VDSKKHDAPLPNLLFELMKGCFNE
jgi:hypothetical protein